MISMSFGVPSSLPSRFHRATAPVLVVAIGSLSLVVVTLGSAAADPATVPGPVAITATGGFSGTVPAGVCSVQADVLGAAGGHNTIGGGESSADANGGGARLLATYPVVSGMAYAGTVGGGGSQADTVGSPGSGGSNGGGSGGTVSTDLHPGSGGGGWTDLQLGGTLALLAGGGGGSAGGHSTNEGFGGNAGLPSDVGVTAGSNGVAGRDTTDGNPVTGGQGGQVAAPGDGGVNGADGTRDGAAGSDRNGGDGGTDSTPDSGGGGGGGFFGAGGGASTLGNGSGGPIVNGIAGAGGGGGSSSVATTALGGPSAVSSAVGPRRATGGDGADGAVTLTWVPCDYDLGVIKSVSSPAASVGATVTWTIEVTNNGPDPMTQGDTVTLTDTLPGAGPKTITDLQVGGGANNQGLARGPVTCDATTGDPMPATLTCSRPYSAPSAPGAPSGGVRGLDPNETITVAYTSVVPGPTGAVTTNIATVDDRSSGGTPNTDDATVTATLGAPPTADPDVSSGPQGVAQSVDPLSNDTIGDAPLDPATLTLLNGAGNPVGSVTVAGEGTYTINGAGRIVFTPLPNFVGTATPVDYRIADTNGATATSAYTPSVLAEPPVTVVVTQSGPVGSTVELDLVAQVPGLDPASIFLIAPNGDQVRTLSVPGEGTGSVDPETGIVTFTPEDGFRGDPTPVKFVGTKVNSSPVKGLLKVNYLLPTGPQLPDTGANLWLLPLGALGFLALAGGTYLLRHKRPIA